MAKNQKYETNYASELLQVSEDSKIDVSIVTERTKSGEVKRRTLKVWSQYKDKEDGSWHYGAQRYAKHKLMIDANPMFIDFLIAELQKCKTLAVKFAKEDASKKPSSVVTKNLADMTEEELLEELAKRRSKSSAKSSAKQAEQDAKNDMQEDDGLNISLEDFSNIADDLSKSDQRALKRIVKKLGY